MLEHWLTPSLVELSSASIELDRTVHPCAHQFHLEKLCINAKNSLALTASRGQAFGVLREPGAWKSPPRWGPHVPTPTPRNLPPGTAGWGRPGPSGSPRWQCWAAASAAPAAAGGAFAPCPSGCPRTSPRSVKSSPVVRHSGKWRGGYRLVHWARDTQSAWGLAFWTAVQRRGRAGRVFKCSDGPSSSLNSTINRAFQGLSLGSVGLWCLKKPFCSRDLLMTVPRLLSSGVFLPPSQDLLKDKRPDHWPLIKLRGSFVWKMDSPWCLSGATCDQGMGADRVGVRVPVIHVFLSLFFLLFPVLS